MIAIDLDPDVSFSNNFGQTLPEGCRRTGDVIGNPKLVKTGEPYAPEWFRLTGLSPAIDKAN